MTKQSFKITADMQAAIDLIAENNGSGANSRQALKDDNMTWYDGLDLMDGLGWSMQKAGGVILALEKAGLSMQADTRKKVVVEGEVQRAYNRVLTNKGIDFSSLDGYTPHHWPTPAECKVIRDYAKKAAKLKVAIIEAGERTNTQDGSVPRGINELLVSKTGEGDDTDLFQHVDWESFIQFGFPMAHGGNAEVDFYVYSTGEDGELETNVQGHWNGGKLVRMSQTEGPDLKVVL